MNSQTVCTLTKGFDVYSIDLSGVGYKAWER